MRNDKEISWLNNSVTLILPFGFMKDKISILILTHNRANDLLALLQSLSQQASIDEVLEEILILNNASTESYNQVTNFISENPQLRTNYIFSELNHGVAKGRNMLMKAAKGDVLFTIDDDMEFPQTDALLRISTLFHQPFFTESNTAVITLRVIYYSDKQVQKTVFPHKKYEKFKDKHRFLTLYFAGGANIMKRSILKQTGYFPENFFYGMEEYDLCYRILDEGYTIGYDDSVTIEHKESPYGRQANYKKLHMQWVNKSKVAWRYLPLRYFLSTSFLWSFQYLMNAPTHLGLYFNGWSEIFKVPSTEKRKRVKNATLRYLKNVEARLWF